MKKMTWSDLLWKAKPSTKKKRVIRLKNMMIDQESNVEIGPIQREFLNWQSTCNGLTLADIGITGRGHAEGKGKDTLLEHMENHVKRGVQREGMPAREGVEFTVKKLTELIIDENTIIQEDDEDILLEYIDDLTKMAGTDADPRNIHFTQPEEVKRVKGEWKDVGKDDVYGHYRTPIYVDSRKKVHNSKKEQDAVDSSWYNGSENEAKPPMWQAIFAGAEGITNSGKGNLLDNGILKILQDFKKYLDGMYIQTVIINDKGKFEQKIDSLSKLKPLIDKLVEFMNDSNTYRGGGHQLLYTGPRGIITRLETEKFNAQGAEEYLQDLGEDLESVVGADDIKQFSVKLTPATVNRLINAFVRPKFVVPNHLKPNGKPFLLSSAGGGRKTEGQPWSAAYNAAVEKSKIKKSWIDSLWG